MQPNNWTGQKIGMITIINKTDEKYFSKNLWLGQCDCGRFHKVVPSLIIKHPTVCDCKYADKKFGMITTICKSTEKESRKRGCYFWKCICACGKIKNIRLDSLMSGKVKSCGCLSSSRKKDDNSSAARKVYNRYKESGLSFDDFFEMSQRECYYCGRKPSRTNNPRNKRKLKEEINNSLFIYNGLDRIDSSIGHTRENVRPCCWDCNKAKNALSEKDFLL